MGFTRAQSHHCDSIIILLDKSSIAYLTVEFNNTNIQYRPIFDSGESEDTTKLVQGEKE